MLIALFFIVVFCTDSFNAKYVKVFLNLRKYFSSRKIDPALTPEDKILLRLRHIKKIDAFRVYFRRNVEEDYKRFSTENLYLASAIYESRMVGLRESDGSLFSPIQLLILKSFWFDLLDKDQLLDIAGFQSRFSYLPDLSVSVQVSLIYLQYESFKRSNENSSSLANTDPGVSCAALMWRQTLGILAYSETTTNLLAICRLISKCRYNSLVVRIAWSNLKVVFERLKLATKLIYELKLDMARHALDKENWFESEDVRNFLVFGEDPSLVVSAIDNATRCNRFANLDNCLEVEHFEYSLMENLESSTNTEDDESS